MKQAPAARRKEQVPPAGGTVRRAAGARGRTAWWPFVLFLAPSLLLLILTRITPLIQAAMASLQQSTGFGLETYQQIFGSSTFVKSLDTTLLFNLIINPVQIVLSLILALLLSERVPAAGLLRTLFLIPIAVPQVVGAIVWGLWLSPSGGLANTSLAALGLPKQPFLSSPGQALFVIMLIATWIGVGYWMTFLVAGIKEVPTELLEAASIDGAGWWRSRVSVVVPLIRRQLAFVLVADTVANFLLFVPVQVLTSGGPAGSTDLIMYEAYQESFVFFNSPVAAAEIIVLVVIMLVIVGAQFLLLQPRERRARQ